MEVLEENPRIRELADRFAMALAQGNLSPEEGEAYLCQACLAFRESPELRGISALT